MLSIPNQIFTVALILSTLFGCSSSEAAPSDAQVILLMPLTSEDSLHRNNPSSLSPLSNLFGDGRTNALQFRNRPASLPKSAYVPGSNLELRDLVPGTLNSSGSFQELRLKNPLYLFAWVPHLSKNQVASIWVFKRENKYSRWKAQESYEYDQSTSTLRLQGREVAKTFLLSPSDYVIWPIWPKKSTPLRGNEAWYQWSHGRTGLVIELSESLEIFGCQGCTHLFLERNGSDGWRDPQGLHAGEIKSGLAVLGNMNPAGEFRSFGSWGPNGHFQAGMPASMTGKIFYKSYFESVEQSGSPISNMRLQVDLLTVEGGVFASLYPPARYEGFPHSQVPPSRGRRGLQAQKDSVVDEGVLWMGPNRRTLKVMESIGEFPLSYTVRPPLNDIGTYFDLVQKSRLQSERESWRLSHPRTCGFDLTPSKTRF